MICRVIIQKQINNLNNISYCKSHTQKKKKYIYNTIKNYFAAKICLIGTWGKWVK